MSVVCSSPVPVTVLPRNTLLLVMAHVGWKLWNWVKQTLLHTTCNQLLEIEPYLNVASFLYSFHIVTFSEWETVQVNINTPERVCWVDINIIIIIQEYTIQANVVTCKFYMKDTPPAIPSSSGVVVVASKICCSCCWEIAMTIHESIASTCSWWQNE